MHFDIGELIVWLIVGGLVGNVVGRLVTLKKEGLGRWTNLGVGMGGALVGGFFFNIFHIGDELGNIKITFQDLLSAFVGSLVLVVTWRVIRWYRGRKR